MDLADLSLAFDGRLIEWRGPAPFHFVPLPPDEAAVVREVAPLVTYGWGVIPVRASIGGTSFRTSLFPREGGYLLPVKDAVRIAEGLEIGAVVPVEMTLGR
jgi:hypothetical protein